MTAINKEPHLMTRSELDYTYFRMSGIKPPRYNAPKKEQETFMKVVKIRLRLLAEEQERRKALCSGM